MQEGIAQDDKDLIKAVIAKETTSFFNVDYKTWADQWLKVAYAYWAYSDSSGTSYIEGWDNLNKSFSNYFKSSKPAGSKITNEWQEIRVFGNGAYVRFIQKVNDDFDQGVTSQVRILEKVDGKWKVVYMGAIASYAKGK